MYKQIFISVLFLLINLPAQARWLTPEESPAVVEKFHMNINVQKEGTWSQEVEYVTKVQTEDAKQHSSILTIEYNSSTEEIEVIEAYTQNRGKKFPVDRSAIEDRDKGESRDYDALKIRSVVYPQVQVGSVLYAKYKIITNKPLLKDRWSSQFNVSPGVHVKDYRVRVKSERPLYAETRDPKGYLTVRHLNKNMVEIKNRKTLPGWVHAEKEAFFHPGGVSEVWVSTEKEWQPFLAEIEKDYFNVINAGVPDKLKAWVSEARKKKTTEDQIRHILEKLSTSFRYFGDWRRHDGGLIPRPLKEIEASRYGDCKDLSVLLVSMLKSLNMQAHVALIRRGENAYGEEPDYKLPATNRFNHAIVHVKIDNKDYWLDPTNPVMSLKAYPDISGRPAWVMGEKGGEFMRLSAPGPKDFEHIHDFHYKFNADDSADVTVRAQLKNLAPYRLANELLLYSKSDVLSSTLEYFAEGQEVTEFHYKKEPKTDRMLEDMEIALNYSSGKVAYNAGKSQFWVIPDGVLTATFFETNNRESDLRLSETPFSYTTTRILTNTRLVQDPPATCRVESRWMDMERTVRVDGKNVRIEQRLDLKRPHITQGEFRSKEFRKLQNETKRCFHRAGVLIESTHGST